MVIPSPALGLIPNIPTVADFSGILSIIRAGELKSVAPELGSIRAFARTVGINESTLRSAYLTEGRTASATTQARLDEAIRRNMETLLGRTYKDRSVVDRAYGRNPLARLYLTTPPNVRRMRIIVRIQEDQIPSFQGGRYGNGFYTVTLEYTQRAYRTWEQLKPPTHDVDTIIWQYETREQEVPTD